MPYLARLGISHLYLAPAFSARAGSTHGYDVRRPERARPELGGRRASRPAGCLRRHGLGLILDIVPNHMGIGAATSPGGGTSLERRPAAGTPVLRHRLRPTTGRQAGPAHAGMPRSTRPWRGRAGAAARQRRGPSIVTRHSYDHALPDSPPAAGRGPRPGAGSTRGDAASCAGAQRLPADEATSGAGGAAACELNWRRFFDITELAGVKVEQPAVFEATHGRSSSWSQRGRGRAARRPCGRPGRSEALSARAGAAWRQSAARRPGVAGREDPRPGEDCRPTGRSPGPPATRC